MLLALVLAAAIDICSPEVIPVAPALSYPVPALEEMFIPENDTLHNEDKYVTINNVVVIGNRITKSDIILREVDVEKGQIIYYPDLIKQLEIDEQRVNNLQLFNTVEVKPIELDSDEVIIIIEVTERWYIFPIPIFELVDRNFNVWWEQMNRDLSRTNYGIRLYQRNFRGRNEKLRLTAQFGFTKKFGINYSIPYLDRAQRHGLIIDAEYSENKNIPLFTDNHIQEFFDGENVLYSSTEAGLTYVHRPTFQSFHYFSLTYFNNQIADTVAELNPNYFRFGSTRQRYFDFSYVFIRDMRDVQAYPLKGFYLEAKFRQQGLGIYNDLSISEIRLRYGHYFDLKKDWYLSNFSSATVSTPDQQPYANYRAIGTRANIVRGYELYLIEGPHLFLNKTTLKKRIISIRETINAMPLRQFRHFPLDVYLKTYVDLGYVRNYENYSDNIRLSNTFLAGTGLGIDVHTFYDMVVRLEYSINRDMERGFFLHLRKEF